MEDAESFSFGVNSGQASQLPFLPLTLELAETSREIIALVDSGAAVNVLPHDVGLQLGAQWDDLSLPLRLTGNLAGFEARALVVNASVGSFPPVRLAFAWTRSNEVPVILGQVKFFMEFDACFYRGRGVFYVRPRR